MSRMLDVLIATHGRPELLEQSLRSLLQAAPYGCLGKVIIIENGSRAGAEAICATLRKEGPVEYHWHREANKSSALNYGLSLCADGLVFMTDDDIIIKPEVLSIYARESQHYSSNAFFGGPTDTEYEEPPNALIKSLLPASARGWSSTTESMLESGFFIGFNWAAFKSDMIAVGGFNPDFGPGGRTGATGQESEMQRRLRAKGARAIYLADAQVTHQVPRERCDPDWLLKRSFRQGVERGIISVRTSLESAERSLKLQRRRNRLLRLKATLLLNSDLKYKCSFYTQRIDGFAKALALFKSGQLSSGPYFTRDARTDSTSEGQ